MQHSLPAEAPASAPPPRACWLRPAPRWRLLDVNQKVAAETRDRHQRHRHSLRRRRQRRAPRRRSTRPRADHGPARILINCAGIGTAKRIVGRDGPMALADFDRVVRVNLIGTFNAMRLAAADDGKLDPLD